MASHSSATSRGKRRRFAPRLEMMEDRQLLSAAVKGVTLDPVQVPKFVNELPNPLDPTFINQPTGTFSDGTTPLYKVGIKQFSQDLGLGLPVQTEVYGYETTKKLANGTLTTNATYPGGTFVVDKDHPIAVQWNNQLPVGKHLLPVDPTVLDPTMQGTEYIATLTNGQWDVTFPTGIPAVTHVHGGHTPAAFDGTPQQWFTAGGLQGPDFVSNPFVYPNSQQAGTIWYHDHAMGVTRLNVYAGLAGFYIVHDTNENNLIASNVLPNEKYDIPLAIQDRMFTAPGVTGPNDPNGLGGQLYYPADVLKGTTANFPSVHPEFFGDTILVNGKAWPQLQVEPRIYRFRVLNGSNSRFYNLQFNVAAGKDQPTGQIQPFFQIGTDDGLLAKPVALNQLLIAPGERDDIVVDFSKLPKGTTLIMTNTAKGPFPHGAPSFPETTGQIMAFRVTLDKDPSIPDATLTTNTTLNTDLPSYAHPTDENNVRQLGLFETKDQFGRLIQMVGPNEGDNFPATTNVFRAQDYLKSTTPDTSMKTVPLGAIQEWQIFNTTADTHPIHLHSVSFQIVSRQQFTWTVTNPTTGEFKVTGLKGPLMLPAANEAGWKDTVQMNPGEVTIIRAKFDVPGTFVWHCHILEHEEHDMMNEFVVGTPTASPQPAAQLATSSSTVSNALALAPSVDAVSPGLVNSTVDPLGAEVVSSTKKKQQ